MPTITLSLEEIASRGVDRKALPGLLDRLGMSLEEINDKEATIEITPNRPDLLEVIGLCRALRQLDGRSAPKENHYTIKGEPYLKITVGKGVKRCRPFIAGFVAKEVDLKGVKIKELMRFQEKLHETYGRKRKKMAIGIYDLKKVEGDIVYEATKEGRMVPLGSQKEMSFGEVVKFAGQEGWAEIVKGYGVYPQVRDLKKVLSLVPILNCEGAKVTEKTRDLFVEVTGTSWQTVDDTANILASLFIDSGAVVSPCGLLGGKVAQTPTMKYREFKLSIKKLGITLGRAFGQEELIALAGRMGYLTARYGGDKLLFIVPPYRADVISERDLMEDVAIAFGYDRIAPLRVVGSSVGVPDLLVEYSETASFALIGLGFSETINTYLISDAQCFEKMRRKKDNDSVVRVAYSKTESLSVLRDSVLPSLMGNLSVSMQTTMPQRLFEIGSIFRIDKGKVVEERSIAIVSEHSRSNFSEIKAAVLGFLEAIGAPKPELKEAKDGAFVDGRAADVIYSGKIVGSFGEIHPDVLSNFRLEEPVTAAELNLNTLLHIIEEENKKQK